MWSLPTVLEVVGVLHVKPTLSQCIPPSCSYSSIASVATVQVAPSHLTYSLIILSCFILFSQVLFPDVATIQCPPILIRVSHSGYSLSVPTCQYLITNDRPPTPPRC